MENTRIVFNSKFTNVKPINDEFTEATAYVCAVGKNRNFSSISQETVEKALPTLWNVPIVAHLYQDDNGNLQIGGHDYVLQQDENGSYVYKSLCVPYGVVPERPDAVEFEEIEEPDGRGVFTYLKVPVVIWSGRYPEIADAFFGDGVVASQSMEIAVNAYQPLADDPNYTEITDFSFSALTLLGKDVEPCFPEAKVVEDFSLNDERFMLEFATLKSELAECFGKMAEVETISIDQVDNDVSTSVAFDQTESVCESNTAIVSESGCECENSKAIMFSATYRDKYRAISSIFKDEYIYDDAGELIQETMYYLCDFDDQFAYFEKDVWMSDSYNCENFRIGYTYDKDNGVAAMTSGPEFVILRWLTKEEENEIDKIRNEYDELYQYKQFREAEDKKLLYDETISEFSNLSDIDEFNEVYQNRYSYKSIDDLKNACYLIRGKYSIMAQKKNNQTEPTIPIIIEHGSKTLRERLHDEYSR